MTTARAEVLLVDDNADLREALELLLELEGFKVIPAASGEECLRLLESGRKPCVIVLDLLLPGGLSGIEVRARLAAHAEWAGIPLVILSGVNKPPEVTAAELGLPVDHVMLKPGDVDALFALVARYCRDQAA